MKKLLTLEPALVIGVIVAVVALLVSLGLPVSEEQSAAVVGVVVAAFALGQALLTRSQVSPASETISLDFHVKRVQELETELAAAKKTSRARKAISS